MSVHALAVGVVDVSSLFPLPAMWHEQLPLQLPGSANSTDAACSPPFFSLPFSYSQSISSRGQHTGGDICGEWDRRKASMHIYICGSDQQCSICFLEFSTRGSRNSYLSKERLQGNKPGRGGCEKWAKDLLAGSEEQANTVWSLLPCVLSPSDFKEAFLEFSIARYLQRLECATPVKCTLLVRRKGCWCSMKYVWSRRASRNLKVLYPLAHEMSCGAVQWMIAVTEFELPLLQCYIVCYVCCLFSACILFNLYLKGLKIRPVSLISEQNQIVQISTRLYPPI